MPDPVVGAYARALHEVAQAEGVLARVEDELFRFARVVESEPGLRERLTDPAVEPGAKSGIIDRLLAGRAHPQTTAAVLWINEVGRGRQIADIADELVRLAAEARRHAVAEVRTAVALDAGYQRRLASALSRATGKDVELKVVVDPGVVGGVVVRMGDEVIDGSIARRLAELRARLTGA